MSIAYAKSADIAFYENKSFSYIDVVKSNMRSTEQKVVLFILILAVLIWLPMPFVSPSVLIAQPGIKVLYSIMTISTPILIMQWGMDASMNHVQQHMFTQDSCW